MRRGERFNLFVENDTFDDIADVAAVEHMGDIWHRNNYEAAGVGGQRRLDALPNAEEWQGIFAIDAIGVAHSDAGLADAAQTLLENSRW